MYVCPLGVWECLGSHSSQYYPEVDYSISVLLASCPGATPRLVQLVQSRLQQLIFCGFPVFGNQGWAPWCESWVHVIIKSHVGVIEIHAEQRLVLEMSIGGMRGLWVAHCCSLTLFWKCRILPRAQCCHFVSFLTSSRR